MKALSEFELKAVQILLKKRDEAQKRVDNYNGQLALYQKRCLHPKIQISSTEDFVMKFQGCCPNCGKTILSKNIIKILHGQYSKKE